MPLDAAGVAANIEGQKEDYEETLIRQAESVAVAAPVIPPSERKRQAGIAAGMRKKSEAET